MRIQNPPEKQNTENARPVYGRKLPPGRTLRGAAPGLYGPEDSFVLWDDLGAETVPFRPEDGGKKKGKAGEQGTELFMLRRRPETGSGVLVLPEGIVSVGEEAFRGCSMAAVVFPEGFLHISDKAFADCSLVSAVFPPSLRYIGRRAFSGSRIESAVFPENTETAGSYSFSGTEHLVSVFVPEGMFTGVSAFGESGVYVFSGNCPECAGVFEKCRHLVSAEIRYGKRIPRSAFRGCSGLRSVSIAEGTEEIGPEAFFRCRSLAGVTIPRSAKLTDYGAFSECSSLAAVKYSGTECLFTDRVFYGTPAEKNGQIPAGA